MTAYEVPDDPKMLRETLCLVQSLLTGSGHSFNTIRHHSARLQHLIDACDRHRPLGPDGKHGNLHTPTCGCEDKPVATPARPWEPDYGYLSRDPEKLARALEAVRRQICAYGPDARRCDCKYGLTTNGRRNSEQTGCPELRSVIHNLLHPDDPQGSFINV